MGTIVRPSVLNNIHRKLDNAHPHLEALDFDIISSEGKVYITYKFEAGYFIEFKFSDKKHEYTESVEQSSSILFGGGTTTSKVKRKDHLIEGSMSPGEIGQVEQFDFHGVDGIYSQIEKWIDLFWEDLSSNPLIRQFSQQQENLEDFLKKVDLDKMPDGDQHFTKKEIQDLEERLKILEQKLTEELNQAVTDKDQLAKDLKELKTEFDLLKETLPKLTKKGWVKKAMSKIYIWGSKKDNQKLLKATTEYGRALLDMATDAN